MRVRARVDQSDGQARTLDVAGESIRLGRDTVCEVAVDAIAFPKVSGLHARIEPAREGFVLVHLSRSNLQWITLATLAVAGTAVGLVISALARSEEVATALVPIAVIPQIILAGVVAPLNGLARLIAKGFITVSWAQKALESLLPAADLEVLRRPNEGFSGPWTIVLAQAAAAAVATVVVLWQTQGKSGSR
jgi:hypothetical protein